MKAKDRYYQAKDGKLSFRVREHTAGENDEISPWVPIDQVEINDSLACSRDQLGPIVLARKGTIGLPGDFVHLWGVYELVAIVAGPQIVTVDDYRIATPDELKSAGLWDD